MNQPDLVLPSQALNRITPDVIDTENSKATKDKLVQHGYSVGHLNFLIKGLTQAEIIDDTTIYPVPKCQEGLRGLINVRGSLIPVFDMKTLLDLENKDKEHILVLGKEDNAIAILIDSLPSQPALENKMQQTPPIHNLISEYVDHTYMDTTSNVWMEFDYERFFLDKATEFNH